MLDNYIFTTKDNVTHGRGYVYSLQYHIVWCTKYRKPIFTEDEVVSDLKLWLNKIADDLKFTIMAMEVMPDHIHLLIDAKPQLRISDAIKILKGNTARWLFLKYPNIKLKLWNGCLWNPSYFVVTVSDRSIKQVEQYIKEQKLK